MEPQPQARDAHSRRTALASVAALGTAVLASSCCLPLFPFLAAAGAAADEIAWAEHIGEFGHVRRATIALYRNMPADAWMRSGTASDNRFTVRAMAFITGGHLAHHLRILREKYL